jgi:hypothetical protein
MSKIIPFRNPRHVDIDGLATAIFVALGTCRGVEPRELIAAFRKAHPEATNANILAGFHFARKIIGVFQTLLLEMDADHDGGGAA